MQDLQEKLAEIMQPILAEYADSLKQATDRQKKEEARHRAFKEQYGDFVGDVLYYEQMKD